MLRFLLVVRECPHGLQPFAKLPGNAHVIATATTRTESALAKLTLVFKLRCTYTVGPVLCFLPWNFASRAAGGPPIPPCRATSSDCAANGKVFMKSILFAVLSALQAKMRPDCWLTMYPRRGSNPHLLLICDQFQEGRQSTYTMEAPYPLDHPGFCRRLPIAK